MELPRNTTFSTVIPWSIWDLRNAVSPTDFVRRKIAEVDDMRIESLRLNCSGTQGICVAPFRENSPLKRPEWHMLTKDHTVLPAIHTFIHE